MDVNLDWAFPHWRQQLSSKQQLLAAGVSSSWIKEAHKAGTIRRRRRGVYSPVERPPRGEFLLTDGRLDLGFLAELRELALSRRSIAFAGRCGALVHGYDLAVEPTELEIGVAPGCAWKAPGVVSYQIDGFEPVEVRIHGYAPLPVLSAVDTVVHCAMTLPLREAVTIADSAMRIKKVTLAQLKKAARAHRGKPNYRRLRKVIAWSDPQCGSVLESLFRVLILEAGIVRPQSQFHIRVLDGSTHRVDFCWVEVRLVVETDGQRWHNPADRRNADRRRDNGLECGSLRLLRFSWHEVVHDPEWVVTQVRVCLEGWMSRAA